MRHCRCTADSLWGPEGDVERSRWPEVGENARCAAAGDVLVCCFMMCSLPVSPPASPICTLAHLTRPGTHASAHGTARSTESSCWIARGTTRTWCGSCHTPPFHASCCGSAAAGCGTRTRKTMSALRRRPAAGWCGTWRGRACRCDRGRKTSAPALCAPMSDESCSRRAAPVSAESCSRQAVPVANATRGPYSSVKAHSCSRHDDKRSHEGT